MTGLGQNGPATQRGRYCIEGTGTQRNCYTKGLIFYRRDWDTTGLAYNRLGHNGTETQRDRRSMGLGHNGTGSQRNPDTKGPALSDTGEKGIRTQWDWDMGPVLNGTGTRLDRSSEGLGHNRLGHYRTGTQLDWDSQGRPLNERSKQSTHRLLAHWLAVVAVWSVGPLDVHMGIVLTSRQANSMQRT